MAALVRGWVEAWKAPSDWEGREVWVWRAFDTPPHVYFGIVPVGYSRVRHHCDGIFFRRMWKPKAPVIATS